MLTGKRNFRAAAAIRAPNRAGPRVRQVRSSRGAQSLRDRPIGPITIDNCRAQPRKTRVAHCHVTLMKIPVALLPIAASTAHGQTLVMDNVPMPKATAPTAQAEFHISSSLNRGAHRPSGAAAFPYGGEPGVARDLSAREREILHWLALGKTTAVIGAILSISACTVRVHVRNILVKLHASNIPHAIALAFAKGILPRSHP